VEACGRELSISKIVGQEAPDVQRVEVGKATSDFTTILSEKVIVSLVRQKKNEPLLEVKKNRDSIVVPQSVEKGNKGWDSTLKATPLKRVPQCGRKTRVRTEVTGTPYLGRKKGCLGNKKQQQAAKSNSNSTRKGASQSRKNDKGQKAK